MTHVADTDPYPWPYDGVAGLDPARTALLLTGVQEQWRSLAADSTIRHLEELAGAMRALGVLVVLARHAHMARATGRPAAVLPAVGSPGWALVLTPAPADLVIDTPGHDGFLSGRLDLELRARGRDHLVMAGLGAEVLLDTTLRSANDRGYECLVLTDLAIPFDPLTGARALDSVTKSGGIFGALGSTRAVCAAYGAPIPEELTT